jgi:hypothetical protein
MTSLTYLPAFAARFSTFPQACASRRLLQYQRAGPSSALDKFQHLIVKYEKYNGL